MEYVIWFPLFLFKWNNTKLALFLLSLNYCIFKKLVFFSDSFVRTTTDELMMIDYNGISELWNDFEIKSMKLIDVFRNNRCRNLSNRYIISHALSLLMTSYRFYLKITSFFCFLKGSVEHRTHNHIMKLPLFEQIRMNLAEFFSHVFT